MPGSPPPPEDFAGRLYSDVEGCLRDKALRNRFHGFAGTDAAETISSFTQKLSATTWGAVRDEMLALAMRLEKDASKDEKRLLPAKA
ncbi:MAG: hypothetical protein WCL16_08515 [bacterium]